MNKYKKNIKIHREHTGNELRQDMFEDIQANNGYLPQSVSESDMDASFVEFVKKDLSVTMGGRKVPVIFLTIQRWSEFTKTWEFSDKNKDIKMPFITITRRPDVQVGENQAGLWNIPGKRTYTYLKVPTWDGVRNGVDVYKIPQPVAVNLMYEVRFFANKLRQLNELSSVVHETFQSRQFYIRVNEHPMPIVLESITDESNIEDFENRRFYVEYYEMKLMGLLQNAANFEVTPSINRALVFTELDTSKYFDTAIIEKHPEINSQVGYTIIFKPYTTPEFSFISKYNTVFTSLFEINGISNIKIHINDVLYFDGLVLVTPISVNENNKITITITKRGQDLGSFKLIGNKNEL